MAYLTPISAFDLRGQEDLDNKTAAAKSLSIPLLTSSFTTILGLLPMAIFVEELWFAMSVVIMFGLAAGTVLTLGFVPTL